MYTLYATTILSGIVSIVTALAAEHLLSSRVAIMGEAVGFAVRFNRGIAFGLPLPEPLSLILIPFALVFVSVLARDSRHSHLSQIGFGLILGGGAANLIDRIIDSSVTDFIQIFSFPTFNSADACITIGAVLLLSEAAGFTKRTIWYKKRQK